ncbi:MAG: TIM barrel protein [bacterium]
MNKLQIGTGGIPLSAENRSIEAGVKRLEEIGLNHLELEFVQSVYLDSKKAYQTKEKIKATKISLSIHAPYYINLASDDPKIRGASIIRIEKSLEIGHIIGAKSVTFHSAFFQKKSSELVRESVINGLRQIQQDLSDMVDFSQIQIAPELTGKPTQYGSLVELISIAKELKIGICIDFAHYFARTNGQYNSYDQFMETFDALNKALGPEVLEQLHMHISGIIHSEKGERYHVTFLATLAHYLDYQIQSSILETELDKLTLKNKNGNSLFKWKECLKAIKVAGVGGYLVCESPVLEYDALLLQNIYDNL